MATEFIALEGVQKEQPPPVRSFPLAMAEDGQRVRIHAFHRGRNVRQRLAGMGIQVGDVVMVVKRHGQGAVVISKADTRYALGGGMALKIVVTKEN